MRKFLGTLCILTILFSGCEKYKSIADDTNGDSFIRGRLFLFDTLTSHILGEPLPSKTIQLFYNNSTDNKNNLLFAVADKEGYFLFKNLNKDSSYRIYYEEKIENNIVYTAERKNIIPPSDTLVLNAFLNSNKQSGIHYTIRDTTGAPVRDAKICIYSNSLFFTTGTCANSDYSLTTDRYGHAFAFNIQPATYYVTVYIEVNGSKYMMNDTPTIGNMISYRTLALKKIKQTGYNITVMDSLHTILPGVQLCFFSSEVASNIGNCSGSNFQNTADANGIAKSGNITPGKYYVLANIKLDSLNLFGKEMIEIVKDNITNDTIVLRKK